VNDFVRDFGLNAMLCCFNPIHADSQQSSATQSDFAVLPLRWPTLGILYGLHVTP